MIANELTDRLVHIRPLQQVSEPVSSNRYQLFRNPTRFNITNVLRSVVDFIPVILQETSCLLLPVFNSDQKIIHLCQSGMNNNVFS